ncbi:cellulose binding domain-containing protein [Dactylosporangium sp. NPDC049140]|uniref:cellulose binding domain-containing protein n=1 Tax=Dactylosporangium sp. NPDC049140 TaxID=3155647 RepID=UPI0033C8FDF3
MGWHLYGWRPPTRQRGHHVNATNTNRPRSGRRRGATAGGKAITGGTARWTLAGGQSISQVWNGLLSTSGSTATVANESYNGALAAGASTTFGFLATGTATTPAVSCSGT